LTDFDEIWNGEADWPPYRGQTVIISNLKKDGGGRNLENHNNRDISLTV